MDAWHDYYYKIRKNHEDKLEVREFSSEDDEDRFDWNDFFADEDGFHLKFNSYTEAVEWLDENVKREFIDPDDLKSKVDWTKYLKEDKESE
ncbi:hypothetical protein Bp8pC_019 [Bacillus phage Bp8p-C]|uniref:Uncharacterized protein n=2 Tax=Agatevirus Bp8pC TaxID=1910937 RepID=A0A0A0PL64_9CAUD|nr:hypothetical protein AXJ20_gp019 [Bacillus phage Bp8p-C]YP_009784320.1 hypothetical protein QLX39_gp019 [Bacillus phage Bp8p-T]AHJ87450.1 hypothetical protein Bp8pC_019 [Bacillus phage Bp8p-C]AHJ87661.1 hypothetical protein Bp8pT_019 [Bacillus phage Bp8p-T]